MVFGMPQAQNDTHVISTRIRPARLQLLRFTAHLLRVPLCHIVDRAVETELARIHANLSPEQRSALEILSAAS